MKVSSIQSDLTAAYKEKAELAEVSLAATKKLAVVRDISDHQAGELKQAHEDIKRLKEQLKHYKNTIGKLEAALETATQEAASAAGEASATAKKAADLQRDNSELARRLVELKEIEIERMNEINKMREETLERARKEAQSILDKAHAHLIQSGGADIHLDMKSEDSAALFALPTTARRNVPQAHKGGCFGLAFVHKTGRTLASCGADKTVKLWDPLSGVATATLHGAFESINAVVFTADNKCLLGAENKEAVRLWDISTGRLRLSLTGHSGKVTGVDTSPSQVSTAASCGSDRSIKIWGLEKGFCVRTMLCPSTPNAIAFSGDGAMLISTHFDGALRFWDPRNGKQAHEMIGIHSGPIGGVAVGLQNNVIVTAGRDNTLKIIDPRKFEGLLTLSAPGFTVVGTWAQPAISPDVHFVASGSVNGSVYVWDLIRKGALASQLKAVGKPPHPVVACAWSPCGLPIVSSDKMGGIVFWSDN